MVVEWRISGVATFCAFRVLAMSIADSGTVMLKARDGQATGGGGVDKFRIKIWDTSTDQAVYDNQYGDTDDSNTTTELGGGSIVTHDK